MDLKKAYTNNPAWLFRYLVKNERFGLARHAGYIDVDDGALYVLSQYCDQLVDDGYGGLEPRMTLNAYITEQMSARDLLDNIAGMFRGIALWDGQRLTVMIDAPQDQSPPSQMQTSLMARLLVQVSHAQNATTP